MSGTDLVRKLDQLGYPAVGSLDPQSLDWMFEHDAVADMLTWFCQNVNTSNFLEPQEMQEYKDLCSSGEITLKGRQLEEALSHVSNVEDGTVNEETIRQEVEQLTASLQQYSKKKKQLMRRRNLLSNHHTALSHRLSKLGAVETKTQHQYKRMLEQTHEDNKQVNGSLVGLTQSVEQLSQLYSQPSQQQAPPSYLPSQAQTGSPAKFLSHVPVQQYYSMEEDFTSKLTTYTKKQFFEGIADMASSGEESRYEILQVSDPDSLLVRGESEDVNVQECKELARLQALYGKSESQAISSLCSMRRLKSQVQAAENILDTLKTGSFCVDMNKNRERLQKLQSSVQSVRRDYTRLAETAIQDLIVKCKDAKVVRVLTGDYNLKLARQDYFTSNQDKVIEQLILQRSRNEFLTMAFEVELRRHRELHHILTSVHTVLKKQHKAWQDRMAIMSDSSLTPSRHKRETVDSRDKSTARLYAVLDENEGTGQERQLFLPYSALVENAHKLQERHSALRSSLQTLLSGRQDRVQLLENNLQTCEELVYSGSSTTIGQPLLTPREVQDTIVHLQDILHKLKQGIMDVVREFEAKKKLLRSDKLLVKERNIFTYFFSNPAKLHQTLEELNARLQAEKHVESQQGSQL